MWNSLWIITIPPTQGEHRKLIGPFAKHSEAADYADRQFTDDDVWYLAQLDAPGTS